MDAALQSLRNTVEFESLYVWQFIKINSRDKKFHIGLVSGLMLLIFVIIILAASLPSSKSSRSNIQKQGIYVLKFFVSLMDSISFVHM